MRTFPLLLAGLSALALSPAHAQSSLGLNFGEATLSTATGNGTQSAGQLTGDWRIGPSQGIQLDLSATSERSGYIGQVSGHLYLQPQPDRKYGFVASLADANDREATVAAAGVAGMWMTGDATVVQGAALLGFARPNDLDFVALSGRIDQGVGDRTTLFADVSITDVEEAAFSATVGAARLGLSQEIGKGAASVYAAAAFDQLWGADAEDAEARIEIGLTIRLGTSGSPKRPVAQRAFAVSDPFAPLFRRGLF